MSADGRDDLFAARCCASGPFRFDASVARVFPDMVSRSVPCYRQLVELTGLVGARFLQPGTRCYDLGCSLGAVTFSLLERAPEADCRVVAVDSSAAMVAALAARLRERPDARARVSPVCADLASVRIENASLAVLNLTLQFLPPGRRSEVLRSIRSGLVPGGALILTEKVCPDDPQEARLLTALHEDFKRANGYSELEISQKRAALERVLIPDTPEMLADRLKQAGFEHRARWFQCLNFVSLLAWT
jgi:tRNA (cmo5U34)-methyltransferase